MQSNLPPQKHLHPGIWITILVLFAVAVGYLVWARESQEWPFSDRISCLAVVTTAKNPQTGEIRTFGSPCDVPEGWIEISNEPLTDSTPSGVEGWQTYRNEEYGFEVKYPGDTFAFSQEFKPEIYVPQDNFLKEGGKLLAWINFLKKDKDKDTHLAQAFITIGIHPSLSERECQAFTSLGASHPGSEFGKKMVNSIKFTEDSAQYAIPELTNETKVYHSFKNNICHEINLHYASFPYTSTYDHLKSAPGGIWGVLDQILSTFKFIEQSSLSSLPPDPGEAGKATLEGIDSDKDGVRDDIQRYITLTYSDSEKTRAALTQIARVMQQILLNASDEPASIVNIRQGLAANDCLTYVLGVRQARSNFAALRAEMLNTKGRTDAWLNANTHFSGQSYEIPDDPKSFCAFNPDSMSNFTPIEIS